jgi:hypothetical protein
MNDKLGKNKILNICRALEVFEIMDDPQMQELKMTSVIHSHVILFL